MSDNLTALIARVQAMLLDNGSIFSTATCTAAVREALKQFNLRAPIHAADLITAVVANQKEYELSALDPLALNLVDVLLQDTVAGGDDHKSLDYDVYLEDERIFFRLRAALSSGTLILRYTIPHTINGLDSATESTLSALYDQILVNGAAAEACFIRSRSRVESNNIDRAAIENYLLVGRDLQKRFEADLARISVRRKTPAGLPDQRAWNDDYHNWNQ